MTNRCMYVQPFHHIRVAEIEDFESVPVEKVGGDDIIALGGEMVGEIPAGMAQ